MYEGKLVTVDDKGHWGLNGLPWKSLMTCRELTDAEVSAIYGALCKLKEYEETGLSPWEVEDLIAKSN